MVNRMKGAQEYAIAPTDEAYRLVGLVKTRWEGISGGPGPGERGGRVLRGDEDRRGA